MSNSYLTVKKNKKHEQDVHNFKQQTCNMSQNYMTVIKKNRKHEQGLHDDEQKTGKKNKKDQAKTSRLWTMFCFARLYLIVWFYTITLNRRRNWLHFR